MFKLNTIGAIEKEYFFEDAVVDVDVLNGAFGTVAAGKFTPDADGTSVIMQVEVGDDAGMPEYKIAKGSHVRTLDTTKLNGRKLEVYGYPLPATFAVGDTLGCFTIEEVIGNKVGAVVKVTA